MLFRVLVAVGPLEVVLGLVVVDSLVVAKVVVEVLIVTVAGKVELEVVVGDLVVVGMSVATVEGKAVVESWLFRSGTVDWLLLSM